MASLAQQGPTIPSDIAVIVGPALLGVVINWFFYGIIIMQMYVYYQGFPNDRKMIKTLVYSIFILDSVQAIMNLSDSFHWFAIGFGNMNELSRPRLCAFSVPILDGIIAFIVQTFFCWRIKILQRSWWLPCIIFGVSLSGLVGSLALGIRTFHVDLNKLSHFKWEFSLWLAGGALADTMIAVIMTWVLLRSRSKDYEQTNNILTKLVRLIVETNIATASLAIVALVVLLAIPKYPTITITPGYTLGKSYSNTFLAILNNRIYMKHDCSSPIRPSTREASSTMRVEAQPSEPYFLDIQVHQQVETKTSPVCAGQLYKDNKLS